MQTVTFDLTQDDITLFNVMADTTLAMHQQRLGLAGQVADLSARIAQAQARTAQKAVQSPLKPSGENSDANPAQVPAELEG